MVTLDKSLRVSLTPLSDSVIESQRSQRSQERRVNYPKTPQKNRVWKIQQPFRSKTIVLGDSNLKNVPAHDLEVHSFPGAKINNLTNLLAKYIADFGPSSASVVILNIGLNNYAQNFSKTTQKEMQKLSKHLLDTFPDATIHFQEIQLDSSSKLENWQKETLFQINEYAVRFWHIIQALPNDHFALASDNYHWSEQTAKNYGITWEELAHF